MIESKTGDDGMDESREVIANRIKTLRRQKGLSQQAVARTLNVDPSTVSNYENGKRSIQVETLKALASLYDTTVDDLIKGVTTSPGEAVFIPRKRPLPVFTPNPVLRGLMVIGLIGVASSLVIESDMFLSGALIIFLVYGGALGIHHYKSYKNQTSYLKVGAHDDLIYTAKMEPGEIKKRTWTLQYISFLMLFMLFVMGGIMLGAFGEDLTATDETFFILYYSGAFLAMISIIVLGIMKKLIKETIPYEKASLTLGTTGMVVMKAIVLVGYIYHIVTIRHYLFNGTFPLNMHPWVFILIVHGMFIAQYLIIQDLMLHRQHYTLKVRAGKS